jgi:hypothetical protein
VLTNSTFSPFATSPERDILLSIIFWPTPMTERFRSKELDMANLLWKLTPSKSWPTADATVDSCQWVRLHDHLGGIAGHYQVKFSYLAGGRVNHGDFCHHGAQHIAPYSVGERLTIQYDPKRPARYHFSGADSSNYEKLEAILVMTVFALLAGYMLYTF